jgi:hypothetical protein
MNRVAKGGPVATVLIVFAALLIGFVADRPAALSGAAMRLPTRSGVRL